MVNWDNGFGWSFGDFSRTSGFNNDWEANLKMKSMKMEQQRIAMEAQGVDMDSEAWRTVRLTPGRFRQLREFIVTGGQSIERGSKGSVLVKTVKGGAEK